ncbi:hypothetical protein HMPREF9628_01299 [Peptoanaerobacter stomatis]|uniref:Uncharacterized protein n=1 Tax=Peptoanaerobacter stomatis TaxID=796937 RepID=G9XBD2_9FIRM|nr:hypothetical protein [Peptoanaerobacter stomatis]EHL19783.1 hypothetical protein HMPREF9628_01299 [Peptoanaerobacter stomatis]
MPKKKDEILQKEQENIAEDVQDKFTKEQLIKSKKYEDKRDILNVILEDKELYSISKVDEMIEVFLKEEVE